MSKRLIGSIALTIAWLTVPAHAQPAEPSDLRAAWFANLPQDERDAVIHDVRAQYHNRMEQWRTLPSDQRQAVLQGAQTDRQARAHYRAWAWQDWRKDRGRPSEDP